MRFNEEVAKVLEEIQKMLVAKNAKYGNSALEPLGVFSQLSAKEGLLIRIDDKLKRIKNGSLEKDDEDVINDLIGYLVLLKIQTKLKYEPNEALKNAYSTYRLNSQFIVGTNTSGNLNSISNTTNWQSIKQKQDLIKQMQQELRDNMI